MDLSAIAKVIQLQGELINLQSELMPALERRDTAAVQKARRKCAQHTELIKAARHEAFPVISNEVPPPRKGRAHG